MQPLRFAPARNIVVALGCILATSAAAQESPTISYSGHAIRFSNSEKPFLIGRTVMVSLRPVCIKLGASVRRSRDAIHWTVTRGSDRLDYTFGERWFVFNGARKELSVYPQGRGDVLFVPFELVDSISSGLLEINADTSFRSTHDVIFRGRVVRYHRDEAPVRVGGTIFVSLKSTADAIGAIVSQNGDRSRVTVTRSLDKVEYEIGTRNFVFNGAVRNLRSGAFTRGKIIFVPLDLFQALVGDELRGR